MTLIGLRSVAKFYRGRAVLRGLDLKVNAGARIGLVATNGAGKSTVLRILAGTEEVDRGEVVRRRGLDVAPLSQYVEGERRTPLDIVRRAAGDPPGAPERAGRVRGATWLARGGIGPAPDAACARAPGAPPAPLHGTGQTRLRGRGSRLSWVPRSR
jgi:energy-coupling factor transporter ATP-binding protein EcfA2